MRESPQLPLAGPTLVYESTEDCPAGFYCSRCGVEFDTKDPLVAFQEFTHHRHHQECSRPPKRQRKARAAN